MEGPSLWVGLLKCWCVPQDERMAPCLLGRKAWWGHVVPGSLEPFTPFPSPYLHST